MFVTPSEELAYWIGVVQTDGSLTKSHDTPTIEFTVGKNSLPMLKKFKIITRNLFQRNGRIIRDKRGYYSCKFSVKQLMDTFNDLDIRFGDPPLPPKWLIDNSNLFGAYLAGVIDGDGDIRLKRPKYPQCVIRITSGSFPAGLRLAMENELSSKVRSTFRQRTNYLDGRELVGAWWATEFCISKKNKDIIRNFVLPHIVLKHKSDRIRKFLN